MAPGHALPLVLTALGQKKPLVFIGPAHLGPLVLAAPGQRLPRVLAGPGHLTPRVPTPRAMCQGRRGGRTMSVPMFTLTPVVVVVGGIVVIRLEGKVVGKVEMMEPDVEIGVDVVEIALPALVVPV